jgi:hypothetical protein
MAVYLIIFPGIILPLGVQNASNGRLSVFYNLGALHFLGALGGILRRTAKTTIESNFL